MKTLMTVVIALALLFVVVAPVEAVDLYTVPLWVVGSDWISCDIANVSTTNKTVRIQVLDDNGNILASTSDFVLEPGSVADISWEPNGFAYCRFTVTGAKTHIRAAAKILLGTGSDRVVIPAE